MVPFSQAVILTAIQWDQERKNETKDEDGDNSCWLNIGDARVGFFKQPISLTTIRTPLWKVLKKLVQ